jgi:hypothetical protein
VIFSLTPHYPRPLWIGEFFRGSLNKKVLRIEEIEEFYKAAAQQYPKEYAGRSFDLWMNYLTGYSLILKQPANSIGITIRGKDFLKYLIHWGRSANDRSL